MERSLLVRTILRCHRYQPSFRYGILCKYAEVALPKEVDIFCCLFAVAGMLAVNKVLLEYLASHVLPL